MSNDQEVLNQRLVEAVNAHGSDIQNLNCVISGLVHQLAQTQGNEGLDAAQKYALRVAESMPKNLVIKPNPQAISDLFNGHKRIKV
ncbi:hypothetical protein [Pseudomonas sp. G1002]|uniref:hypothetical protein n=1 Tax=Pseudomonas sp. G1002 TaxID=410942 RepID=UPI0015A0C5DD|nr:hypothetical protein [Pseudomonas sp. G1002]NWC06583.1 hypothetical protein [Pseudomonas sp. G1002]